MIEESLSTKMEYLRFMIADSLALSGTQKPCWAMLVNHTSPIYLS
jgi:hypothetical protein